MLATCRSRPERTVSRPRLDPIRIWTVRRHERADRTGIYLRAWFTGQTDLDALDIDAPWRRVSQPAIAA